MVNVPCLKLIQEKFWNEIKDKLSEDEKRQSPEFEFTMFMQIWSSTAVGFGGIGGDAMTGEYTTVVEDIYSGWCGVFFGERIAYVIKDPNEKFFADLSEHRMVSVQESGVYKT